MRAAGFIKVLAAVFSGLALLLLIGLVSLSHAPGRALVIEVMDGREISAVGVVNLSDLEGDMLSDFRVGRLTLSDDQGVWLEAEDIHIVWRARSLLGSSVRIEEVEAGRVRVLRRPDTEREAPSGESGGGRGIRLNRLLVSELVLEEPVLGQRAALRAEAALARDVSAGLSLTAEIVRTDGAEDRLNADLTRDLDGVIEGNLSVLVESESPLAQLAYAQGLGFELAAEIEGDPEAGAADFTFTVGDRDGINGQGRWRDGGWSLDADTDADAWPSLPSSVRALLSGGSLTGQGRLEPRTGQLHFTSAAGEVSLSRSEPPVVEITGSLNADGLALVLPETLSIQHAALDARLDPETPSRWLTGDLRVEDLTHPQIGLEAANARFMLEREGEDFRFELTGEGQDVQLSNARAGAALGEIVQFTAEGVYLRADQKVRLGAANLRSAGASLEGSGEISLSPVEYDGRFTLMLDDAGRVQQGLSGPVTLRGEGDSDGLLLHIDGQDLTGEGAPYALATGITGEGRVDFSDGFALSGLDVDGRYLRVAGGLQRPQGASVWRGQLDYAVDAESLGVSSLAGVIAGAATLEQEDGALSARIQAQADRFEVGGTSLENPVLRVEIDPQAEGGLAGDWRFDARTSQRDLALQGDLEWYDGAGSVDVASGRFADIAVQGQALLAPDALTIDVTARQDGAIQLWSASLEYEASRDALMQGRLDLSAELENYRLSGVTLNVLNARLSGPVDGLSFELNADGAITEPFTISVGGPVSYEDNALQASFQFAGELTDRTLTSPQPLEIGYGEGALSAGGRLALDGAGLQFELERDESGTDFEYDLSAIPADLVMGLLNLPQAQGDLALAGRFSRQAEVWTGRSRLEVLGLYSASQPALGALDGELSLNVTETGASMTGAFTDTDLEIEIDLDRQGAMTGPGSLLEPDWRGAVRLNGEVGVLAALYMPEDEVLKGVLTVNAEINGMDTSGQVRFRDGALQSALAGRTFEPISAQGSWRNGALIIDSVQIGEGGKSGATGQAEFRATSDGVEGEGRIELNQLYLVDRPELSGGASGYAEFSLEGRVLTLTGEADIQRMDVRPAGSGGASIPQIEVEELNRPDVLDRAYRRPIRIELDYRLRADDRLMVSSRAFSSEWSADVHVTGTANRPRLAGQATLMSGQASLLTAPFDLTSGTVTFDGPVDQTRLAIEGRHEAEDLTVTGRVEGSVRAPEVHFESTPSLPEDEILSRLLFGSGVSDLSPLQASQLAAQLSGAGWMDAMADVRAALGVDRLDVRQNSDGAITVLGGRQLTDDVYLELESGVGQALGSARIEWRLRPSLVLASEVSGDSSNEISLKWRRSFD